MRTPQYPVWSEGLLLTPQHLQAHDRAQEALIAARIGALAPIDWGVVKVAFDEPALAAGEVKVLEFAGVLPDGLPLAFDEPERAPPPRPATGRLAPTASVLEVLLAVPREREGVAAFADAPGANRFVAQPRSVADATDPKKPNAEVQLARPNAVLLFGEERTDDHVALKVAELVRTPSGALALDPQYIPPSLRLAASPWLMGELRRALDALLGSYRRLSEKRRQRDAASEATTLEVTQALQLVVLGAAIPELKDLADAGEASPREAYRALGRLAGELCSFGGRGAGIDPGALPRFDHLDLRGTFSPLFSALRGLLQSLEDESVLSVPLEARPGGIHAARIEGEVAAAQLFLTVAADGVPEAQIAELVPARCKLLAQSQLVGALRLQLPGLELRLALRPPAQLPVRAGAVFFELDRKGANWERIVQEKNLAFYLPPPFDPERTRVELFALKAAGPGGGR